ncbi:MAG: DUF3592 domain-containing protein [Thermoflexales bacterium]
MKSSSWREALRHAAGLEGFIPGVLAFIVGLLFALMSGYLVINRIGPESEIAPGEVIRLTWEDTRGGPTETPDIRFVAADGLTFVIQGVEKPENFYCSGASIKVRYDPANPERASEFASGWAIVAFLVFGAVCLTSRGSFLAISAIRSANRSIAASGYLAARVTHFAEAHGFKYPDEE